MCLFCRWSFRYPSIIAHPARTVLGFRSGFDSKPYLSLQGYTSSQSLKDALGGVDSLQTLLAPLEHNITSFDTTVIIETHVDVAAPLTEILVVMNGMDDASSAVQDPSYYASSAATNSQSKEPLNATNWHYLISDYPEISFMNAIDKHFIPTKEEFMNEENNKLSMDARKVFTPLRNAGLTSDLVLSIEKDLFARTMNTVISTFLKESPPPLFSENECDASASYYFPISQYVVSHFQMTETGVGILEDFFLEDGNFQGHTGEDDELQVFLNRSYVIQFFGGCW